MQKELIRKVRITWFVAWVGFGVLALLLAVASAGGGHGDYLLAKILFPIPMLIGRYLETLSGLPLILAMVQYPSIGVLGFIAKSRSGLIKTTAVYAVISVVCIIIEILCSNNQF